MTLIERKIRHHPSLPRYERVSWMGSDFPDDSKAVVTSDGNKKTLVYSELLLELGNVEFNSEFHAWLAVTDLRPLALRSAGPGWRRVTIWNKEMREK